MKLFSLFAVFSYATAQSMEIWDEYGNVAYVDDAERGSPNFGPPAKGPNMCNGKKIPEVKRGKFHCKALKKNKAKDSNSKGSKKKKCKFVCDEGWKVQWTKQGKAPKIATAKAQRKRNANSSVMKAGRFNGPNRVKHQRKQKMVKSNASPETDGFQNLNHLNALKTNFLNK